MNNLANELESLRSGAALATDLDLGLARLAGPDATDFLHRMLTSDVKKLRPGEGQRSLFLDSKGRVQVSLRLYRVEDGFIAVTERAWIPKLLTGLEKYHFSEKLELKDLSNSFRIFAWLGPLATTGLQKAGTTTLPQDVESHAQVVLKGTPVRIIRTREHGVGGFLLVVEQAHENKIESVFDQRVTAEALEIARIQTAVPKNGIELDEHVYPQEARMEDSFSLNKGCYPGQEVVARMHTYGSPPRILVPLKLASAVAPGTSLLKGHEEVGKVYSTIHDPIDNTFRGLGFVKRGEDQIGAELKTKDQISVWIQAGPTAPTSSS